MIPIIGRGFSIGTAVRFTPPTRIVLRCMLVLFAGLSAQSVPAEKPVSTSVVLTGQALLKSDIRTFAPEVLPNMKPLLKADVVFTNFETAVRETGDALDGFNPVNGSYAPPEALDLLQEMGFNLLALSNNHSFDMGRVGIFNTLRHVKARKVAHAGIGSSLTQAAAPGYLTIGDRRVALVSMASGLIQSPEAAARKGHPGINELHVDGAVPGVYVGYPNPADAARILASIREAAGKASLVIAYQHNHVFDSDFVEMVDRKLPERFLPPAWIRGWTRTMVDAGADIVVLHGAPFVQGVEIYKGKPIFYGLGNLIFELPPMHDHLFGEDAWRSIVPKVEFEGKRLHAVTFRPIGLDPNVRSKVAADAQHGGSRGMPYPATGASADKTLSELVERSAALGTRIDVRGDIATLVIPQEEGAAPSVHP